MEPPLTRPFQAAVLEGISELRDGVSGLSARVGMLEIEVRQVHSPCTEEKEDIGRSILAVLSRENRRKTFSPNGGTPFLDAEEKKEIDIHGHKEKWLVDFIVQRLEHIFPEKAVVCSEDFPWLPTPSKLKSSMQKPDVFVIHKAMYEERKPTSDKRMIRFGIPSDRAFYNGMCIIDFKPKLSDKAFGELVFHVRNLQWNIEQYDSAELLPTHKCALAHQKGIMLVTFRGPTVESVVDVLWDAGGSADAIRDFFNEFIHDFAMVLDLLLCTMELKIPDRGAFLGAGSTGCVFSVSPSISSDGHSSADRRLALKVVVGENRISKLLHEYQNNVVIHKLVPHSVVQAIAFQTTFDAHPGAGMLMAEVGERISRISENDALKALQAFHESKYGHGDARIANLLRFGEKLKWCDLQHAVKLDEGESKAHFMDIDKETLLSSIEVKRSVVEDTSGSDDTGRTRCAQQLLTRSLRAFQVGCIAPD